MPRRSTRGLGIRALERQRVFTDVAGRLWSASQAANALVFTCISDGRQSARALALEVASLEHDVGDETLRAWLETAPKIGTLS